MTTLRPRTARAEQLVRLCLIALVAAGLGACGAAADEPEPPAASTGATSTEEPSELEPERLLPDPPEKPQAMERDDLEGAIAAAEYFLLLYPYVYATGDLDEWEAMSHAECVFCASVSENVGEMHSEGGAFVGSEVGIVDSTGGILSRDNKRYGIEVVADFSEASELDDQQRIVESHERGRRNVTLIISNSDGGWIVRGVEIVS